MSKEDKRLSSVSECHECGYVIDAATEATGRESKPKEGDVSLCAKCGELNIFNADQSLRKPEREELFAIMRDKETWETIRVAKWAIQQRQRVNNHGRN